MTHQHHDLGTIKTEYPLLEMVEFEPDEENELTEPAFELVFNGTTLLQLAEAYRRLGEFLDARYASDTTHERQVTL